MASDEELRQAKSEAAGHAYVAAFNEAADDLSQQELAYERRSHAQTMAQLRIYETALYSIARSACCEGCNEAKNVAQAALNTEPAASSVAEKS
jgi:hypothetical protein